MSFQSSPRVASACAILTLGWASGADAAISFSNGGFETVTAASGRTLSAIELAANTGIGGLFGGGAGKTATASSWVNGDAGDPWLAATSWNSTGNNFIFRSTAAAVGTGLGARAGEWVPGSNQIMRYWSSIATPATPGNPGGTGAGVFTASPSGGSFVGMGANYTTGAVTQLVTGLAINTAYAVSFYTATGQQDIDTGDSVNVRLNVSFSNTLTIPTNLALAAGNQAVALGTIPNHTFSGWSGLRTLTFMNGSSTSALLSFLSAAPANEAPPFVFLDGVTVTQIPEASASLIVAISTAGLLLRRRRK